jgi:drug/metabolite transporter (DMT)-like permease
MLTFHRSWSKKVSTEVIFVAFVLLIGVVILCAGYYRSDGLFLRIGFMVILGGVLIEVYYIIVAPKV